MYKVASTLHKLSSFFKKGGVPTCFGILGNVGTPTFNFFGTPDETIINFDLVFIKGPILKTQKNMGIYTLRDLLAKNN